MFQKVSLDVADFVYPWDRNLIGFDGGELVMLHKTLVNADRIFGFDRGNCHVEGNISDHCNGDFYDGIGYVAWQRMLQQDFYSN
jgi:hypothetical protein